MSYQLSADYREDVNVKEFQGMQKCNLAQKLQHKGSFKMTKELNCIIILLDIK